MTYRYRNITLHLMDEDGDHSPRTLERWARTLYKIPAPTCWLYSCPSKGE